MKLGLTSKIEEIEKDKEYKLNLGTLKKGTEISEKIQILGEDIAHLAITKSCGCTMPSVQILPDGVEITISYDNNKVGIINQWVLERYLENGEQKTLKINLSGQIQE